MKNYKLLLEEKFGNLLEYKEKENTIYYKQKDLFNDIIEFVKRNKLNVNIQLNLF